MATSLVGVRIHHDAPWCCGTRKICALISHLSVVPKRYDALDDSMPMFSRVSIQNYERDNRYNGKERIFLYGLKDAFVIRAKEISHDEELTDANRYTGDVVNEELIVWNVIGSSNERCNPRNGSQEAPEENSFCTVFIEKLLAPLKVGFVENVSVLAAKLSAVPPAKPIARAVAGDAACNDRDGNKRNIQDTVSCKYRTCQKKDFAANDEINADESVKECSREKHKICEQRIRAQKMRDYTEKG